MNNRPNIIPTGMNHINTDESVQALFHQAVEYFQFHGNEDPEEIEDILYYILINLDPYGQPEMCCIENIDLPLLCHLSEECAQVRQELFLLGLKEMISWTSYSKEYLEKVEAVFNILQKHYKTDKDGEFIDPNFRFMFYSDEDMLNTLNWLIWKESQTK